MARQCDDHRNRIRAHELTAGYGSARRRREFDQASAKLLTLLAAGGHAAKGIVAGLADTAKIAIDLSLIPGFLVAISCGAGLVCLGHFFSPVLGRRSLGRFRLLRRLHPEKEQRKEPDDE
jgi:hypothetical protein